ncbi:MAG TPA: hypothetical protein VLZ11_01420 [Flavobacterium sp.]|nr:hypothetical protein [Flavobacterium sp.]
MLQPSSNQSGQQTTSYKVVLPFYVYATASFLVGCVLLLMHTDIFNQHHFNPHTLALTHIMALGWGTMMILGASHQLLPVLIESKLDSNLLAYLSFIFTAVGIPFLVLGFYIFDMGWTLQLGSVLVNLGVLCYVLNVLRSTRSTTKANVHTWFMATASIWLFSATFFGMLLVFNFTHPLLPANSLSYLSIHAHLGIVGWFLMLVIGVGSRLIPMFLISKYVNDKVLWIIYILVNTSLISLVVLQLIGVASSLYYIPILTAFAAIILFVNYCRNAHKVRIRKSVDEQMKVSLLSVLQMLLPLIVLIIALILLPFAHFADIGLLYGFCVFFGWITAIILGMTFKTLPFIVWNKVYHKSGFKEKLPAPKELFSEKVFTIMTIFYISGFALLIVGIVLGGVIVLKAGAIAMLLAALLYAYNTVKILLHKPQNP